MDKEAISRRDFLRIAGVSMGTLAMSSYGTIARQISEMGRPNIVFIMSDDHASHAMSCYGSRINKTPNLDRIAREGIRFDNCFCTNSICAPSRAVILTGKYSHINGVMDNRQTFDGSQQTYPKILQQNGYQTAMIGKWHLKSEPTGFDYWNVLPGQGAYYNPDMIEMGERKRYDGYVTDIITDHSMNWLRKRSSDKPFLLMCQHKAPHRNWQPGPDHLNMYDDMEVPEPDDLFDDYATRSDAAREQTMTIKQHLNKADLKLTTPKRLTDEQRQAWETAYSPKNEAFDKAHLQGDELIRWKYQRYMKDYFRCVASVDDNVGRLLDYLDEVGLASSTLVVYTSDQGFFLGDHGWFDKRFMYEEAYRMPLIMRFPDVIRPGAVNDDLVMNLDFAPTFLDLAGIDKPADMQGESFEAMLRDEAPEDWRKACYYHYFEYPGAHSVKRHYGIRTKRYKLIHFYNDIDAWELYDLQKNPHELSNVIGDPSYENIRVELTTELYRLKSYYGDDRE
jgi:arylsulfatase A-like enzyme